MTCAFNALDKFETIINDDDTPQQLERTADRIAKQFKVMAFWNEFGEINFRALEENEEAGFKNG